MKKPKQILALELTITKVGFTVKERVPGKSSQRVFSTWNWGSSKLPEKFHQIAKHLEKATEALGPGRELIVHFVRPKEIKD